MKRSYHIVVTGKIGSGKSTVSKFLFKHLTALGLAFEYCDFDEIVKEIWSQEQWRAHCLNVYGISSKKEMSEKAFEDPSLLSKVSQDMNPWIIEKVQSYSKKPFVVFDIPLHWQFNLVSADLCLLATASYAAREKRATSRLDWTSEKFNKVDGLQLCTKDLSAFCDLEIVNENKSLQELEQEVSELALKIKAAFDFKSYNKSFIPDKLLNICLKNYFHNNRAYHTTEHLLRLLKVLKKMKADLKDPFYFITALFHDIVYSTEDGYDENEENSAKEFLKVSSMILKSTWMAKNPGLALEIISAIRSTKGHRIVPGSLLPASSLEKIKTFLDADLSILGGSKKEYAAYVDNIAKEFSHIEKELFEQKRKEFLSKMVKALKSNELYQTNKFKDKFTKKALKNLQRRTL